MEGTGGEAEERCMNSGIDIGTIAGIRIRAHWSVVVVCGVLTFALATLTFPAVDHHLSVDASWLLAVVTTLLFYWSLLAHEISHAVVARKNGIAVSGITLWLLGGMAQMKGEVTTPRAEALMTGVGPLVTIILGLAFYITAIILSALHAPIWLLVVPEWLAVMSALLAGFNLIPALPLDGGRLLHAFLWKRFNDRARATAVASSIGRGFGWLIMLLGLADGIWLGSVEGSWFVVLGWFLQTAATSEARESSVRAALAAIHVGDIMDPHPPRHTRVDHG